MSGILHRIRIITLPVIALSACWFCYEISRPYPHDWPFAPRISEFRVWAATLALCFSAIACAGADAALKIRQIRGGAN